MKSTIKEKQTKQIPEEEIERKQARDLKKCELIRRLHEMGMSSTRTKNRINQILWH